MGSSFDGGQKNSQHFPVFWSIHTTTGEKTHTQATAVRILENKKQKGACAVMPQARRCAWSSQIGRRELVFLQVLGFKELEALLHGQAFLQTLYMGGEKEEQTVKCHSGGESKSPIERDDTDAQAKERQKMASSMGRLERHASKKMHHYGVVLLVNQSAVKEDGK